MPAVRGPAGNVHGAGSPSGSEESLAAQAERVAAVAATHADAVDRDARSGGGDRRRARRAPLAPGAARSRRRRRQHLRRRRRLLRARPRLRLDGDDLCHAPDQGRLLVRHGRDSAWHERLLRRLGADQLLLASSTTGGQAGGDVRKSAAAIEQQNGRITLERSATVISYGERRRRHRHHGAPLARRRGVRPGARRVPQGRLHARAHLDWDTLGMRGTCSAGFKLKATGESGADPAGALRPDPRRRP